MDSIDELLDALYGYAKAWGLEDAVAIPYAIAAALDWMDNGIQNIITSGRRSEAYQRQLRARWDAGDRVGLTSRPAINSFHIVGLAVDVSNPSVYFASLMRQFGLVRIGKNHFQTRTRDAASPFA